MNIHAWAARWGIPVEAITELRAAMLAQTQIPTAKIRGTGSEGEQQMLIRLEAGRRGVFLTRNNVGVLMDKFGRPVRYGLVNESKEQNAKIKSGDLVGIMPVKIGPEHLGHVIGQFVSVECKHRDWKWKGDSHEQAQQRWAEFVIAKGGRAIFAAKPEDLDNLR